MTISYNKETAAEALERLAKQTKTYGYCYVPVNLRSWATQLGYRWESYGKSFAGGGHKCKVYNNRKEV